MLLTNESFVKIWPENFERQVWDMLIKIFPRVQKKTEPPLAIVWL